MVVKIHFEKLAAGMQAKIDASYRARSNGNSEGYGTRVLKVLQRSGPSAGILGDMIKQSRNRVRP